MNFLWILVALVLILLGMASFFLVFTFILRVRNEREALLREEFRERWEPALLAAILDPGKTPDLIEQVRPDEHLRFLDFVLGYTQRLRGPEKEVLRAVADPFLPEILPQLSHHLMSRRVRAVQTLGTLGLPRFTPEVKRAIGDPSPFVAAMAARLLAHEVGAEAAPELCASLERMTTFRTWYLVDMMVAMGPEAAPAIRAALQNEQLPLQTRAVAAQSLANLSDLGSAELAANLLKKETDPDLLTALLRLLAQIGTGAQKTAAEIHLGSPEFFVRAAATRALAELGSSLDLPLLFEGLNDPSAWVKIAAARGVYRLGGKSALVAMLRKNDPAASYIEQVLNEEGGR